MFVFTAKLNKKKLIAILLAITVAAALIILLVSGGDDNAAQTMAQKHVVRTNEQRVQYLESLGWKVNPEPIDQQNIMIPQEFSRVYADYNELQLKQGFDLLKYAGSEAIRYTYEILNHPTEKGTVVADIIVYRSRVIAGDVQCTAMNGFMTVLSYPG